MSVPPASGPVANAPKNNSANMKLLDPALEDIPAVAANSGTGNSGAMTQMPEEKGFFGRIGNALGSVVGTAKQAVGLEGGRRRMGRRRSKKSMRGGKRSSRKASRRSSKRKTRGSRRR